MTTVTFDAAALDSAPEHDELFSDPETIIRRRARPAAPAPGRPGPFGLGAAGVLETAPARAGFHDITVEAVPSPLRLAAAAECVRFERESFGALHQMLAGVPEHGRADVWDEAEAGLSSSEGPGGPVGPRRRNETVTCRQSIQRRQGP